MTELQGFIASRTPPGWETRPLWSLFRRRKLTGYSDEELLSVYRDYGVIPKSSRDDNHNKESDDLSGYQLVTKGSLVTNKMKAWQGSIAISRYRGIVSPAYYVYEPLSAECDQFLHYLLRSEPYIALYGRISKGVRVNQWDLEHEALRNVPVMLPDLDTQKAIANFLDRETARIDQLIEKKQRLVNVLKERLLSELERHTMPNEPSHDELMPFRWVCRIAEGQVDPTAPEWANQPLIAPNHIESRTGRLIEIETAEAQGAISGKYAFPAGTVVYSKIRPNLAKACVSPVAGMCSADMYPILPNKSLRPQFLLMQLLSAKFTDWATLESMRVAMPKINRETLGSYRFWVPALDIQDAAISCFLAEQDVVERLTDKVRSSIAKMQEYRSALVTAAVTGQIDVAAAIGRGAADVSYSGSNSGAVETHTTPNASPSQVRRLAAAEIIHNHRNVAYLGRIKVHKIMFLAEAHANINEISGRYVRQAAGPYDGAMINDVEAGLRQDRFYDTAEDPNSQRGRITFTPLDNAGGHKPTLEAMLGDRVAELRRIIGLVKDFNTENTEAIATLYAVWNDALIDGEQPDDERIIGGFREEWHEAKQRFTEESLRTWLGWMRRNDLVPRGSGPHTISAHQPSLF